MQGHVVGCGMWEAGQTGVHPKGKRGSGAVGQQGDSLRLFQEIRSRGSIRAVRGHSPRVRGGGAVEPAGLRGLGSGHIPGGSPRRVGLWAVTPKECVHRSTMCTFMCLHICFHITYNEDKNKSIFL